MLYWNTYFKDLFKKKAVLYQGINDMPIDNWFSIHETSDLKHVIHVPGKVKDSDLAAQWSVIYNQFIDTFGLNEDYRALLELKREIEVLKIDLTITEDRTNKVFIAMKERELADVLQGKVKSDANEVRARVEKYMGFRLNGATTSVKDYYSYMKILEKDYQAKAKQSNGEKQ
ncbi:MAG: hypothetical protein JWR61_5843 [Ferruginibacter sp.]|uniref:hypothetical protein n=1 Tax=Ferruginibacter sp. TaxID=1940288 RepID=UPI00265B1FBD|nr:hypothetical protein [Ferruginibacter sp.]MDB5280888.1 hypothetical protein [Ferruginibacter sp.]